MKGFIIEGPDGSGKTHTAQFAIPLYHAGGPPKTPCEMLERTAKLLQMEDVILDRFPIISDSVYGPLIRGTTYFTDFWLTQIHLPVIYCRPSLDTILASELTSKPWKDTDHLNAVKDQYCPDNRGL